MNFLIVFVCLFGILLADDDKYTTKYDNVDFDAIIASDRLLQNYVDCLLERGRCTPDATELKRLLPDALESDCTKCSEVQKKDVGRVIKHLVKNKTEWWEELEAKFDPEHKYEAHHKKLWEQEGLA